MGKCLKPIETQNIALNVKEKVNEVYYKKSSLEMAFIQSFGKMYMFNVTYFYLQMCYRWNFQGLKSEKPQKNLI